MNRKMFAFVISPVIMSTLLAGGRASTQGITNGGPQYELVCSGNPNETLTLPYHSSTQETTSGTEYPGGDCSSFVVDVEVPSYHGAYERLVIATSPANIVGQTACSSYWETFSIRRTGTDGKISVVQSGTQWGHWTSGQCDINGTLYYSFNRPESGTEKYRVLVRASVNGKVAPVMVWAYPQPPA
jgi:hypothetical protein